MRAHAYVIHNAYYIGCIDQLGELPYGYQVCSQIYKHFHGGMDFWKDDHYKSVIPG